MEENINDNVNDINTENTVNTSTNTNNNEAGVNNVNHNINIKKFVTSFIFGALGAVFVLVIIIGIGYFNKNQLSLLVKEYIKGNQPVVVIPKEKSIDKLFAVATDVVKKDTSPSKLSVTDVVKIANPAVVSVIITKEVPKYEIVQNSIPSQNNIFDPFGFFSQLGQPIYRQNGTEKKNIGGGSGFLISNNGYIITNKHVIADTTAEYTVKLSNGKIYPATVIARDAVVDIGVLKINGTGFDYLQIGDSSTIEIGQQVLAIGNALAEFQNSVSQGIVSGLGRSITASTGNGGTETLNNIIQTDAAINPGNSGGPLLNMYGQVIGVNVAVAQNGQNIGFALPINSVKSIINSIIKTGRVSRPYVGVRYVQNSPEIAAVNNLSVDYGLIIRPGQSKEEPGVIPGSPADISGLKENDIILSANGKKLTSDVNFSDIVSSMQVGQTLTLSVISSGQEKVVSVTLSSSSQ